MKVEDYAIIKVDLDGVVDRVCSSRNDFFGKDSNQKLGLTEDESGFEHCIYGDDNIMIWGYAVVFSQVCKVGRFPYNSKLYMQIDYLDSDFDAISQEEMLFELNSSTDYIAKMIVEMTSKYQKKIKIQYKK